MVDDGGGRGGSEECDCDDWLRPGGGGKDMMNGDSNGGIEACVFGNGFLDRCNGKRKRTFAPPVRLYLMQ